MSGKLIEDEEHFRMFAKTVKNSIARYGNLPDCDMVKLQCQQVNALADLEEQFRIALVESEVGDSVYNSFLDYILKEKKNILVARPYFRERRSFFVSDVFGAIRNRDLAAVKTFHLNYHFINLVSGRFVFISELAKLIKQIQAARQELVVMNLPLVISRARIFWSRTQKSHMHFMDLVQVGTEGLIAAIDKYGGEYSRAWVGVAIGRIVGDLISSYCLDGETILYSCNQGYKKIKDFVPGDTVFGLDQAGSVVVNTVVKLHRQGVLEGIKVMFDDNTSVVTTIDHKFLTDFGQVPLSDILAYDLEVLSSGPCDQIGGVGIDVWDTVSDSKLIGASQETVSVVSGEVSTITDAVDRGSCAEQNAKRRMEESVWASLSEEERDVCSQEVLRDLSKSYSETVSTGCRGVEGKEYEFVDRPRKKASGGGSQKVAFRKSGRSKETWTKNRSEDKRVAPESSGREQKDCPQYVGRPGSEGFEVGDRCDYDVAAWIRAMSDKVRRRRQEVCRLCVSGSQGVDRGGRLLALLCSSEHGKSKVAVGESTEKGCDVESGGDSKRRCYVNKDVDGLFLSSQDQEEDCDDETRMAAMVHSHAPISSTRGLVRRRIVSVCFVGWRDMYDIEVSHPKHNFVLPSGIVTSNSSTLLHFYPKDKRKLYTLNKFLARHVHGDYEIEDLVGAISSGGMSTDENEVHGLIAASSVVSVDSPVPNEDLDSRDPVSRYEAPEECRPDIKVEQKELKVCFDKASATLSLLDKKLLRLKGIDIPL